MKNFQSKDKQLKNGEVYWVDFEGNGSVQQGRRPAIILQNNRGNQYSPNTMVIPLTSELKKPWLPTHTIIRAKENGLEEDSMVLGENIDTVSQLSDVGDYITTLSEEEMRRVTICALLGLGIANYINAHDFEYIQKETAKLNQITQHIECKQYGHTA